MVKNKLLLWMEERIKQDKRQAMEPEYKGLVHGETEKESRKEG